MMYSWPSTSTTFCAAVITMACPCFVYVLVIFNFSTTCKNCGCSCCSNDSHLLCHLSSPLGLRDYPKAKQLYIADILLEPPNSTFVRACSIRYALVLASLGTVFKDVEVWLHVFSFCWLARELYQSPWVLLTDAFACFCMYFFEDRLSSFT